jgi:tetratricopeptide (TPR) repeat protein
VKGVLTDAICLIEKIAFDQTKRNTDQRAELAISVLENTTQAQDSEFMWFQLIIEALLKMNDETRESTFADLISWCRLQYAGNSAQLNYVEELGDRYDPHDAVWWYTRDTFVYRVLNTALRRQNIDVLVLFCFLIQHIYEQLKEQGHFGEDVIDVYRGQLMSLEELDRLKSNTGHFISINTLFSTSLQRSVALVYADNPNTDTTKAFVLFEIEVNTRLKRVKPFANISNLSQFGTGEDEVLFMIGSVFRIIDLSRNEELNVWIIKMVLADEEENELKAVFESMQRNKIGKDTSLMSLGNILSDMGKYDEATKYYQRLLKSLPDNDRTIPDCYANLGSVAQHKGDFDAALKYMTKALELELQQPTSNEETELAIKYMNLGCVYQDKKMFDEALKNCSKGLALHLKIDGHDHVNTAIAYHNLGTLYDEQNNIDMALSYYNECLQIQRKLLPSNHPEIAFTLMNLGNVHQKNKEYDLVLIDYKAALSIRLLCIPNHENTAVVYYNIGSLYYNGFKNYFEALISCEKAFEIYKSALLLDHPNVLFIQQVTFIGFRFTRL